MQPSAATLQKMSNEELSKVIDFVVTKPGIGKIAWKYPVDVRDLLIGTDIVIKTKQVSLYSDTTTDSSRRRSLDQAAAVSLMKFHPKENMSVDRYEAKLCRLIENIGANFESYSSDTGELRYAVAGF